MKNKLLQIRLTELERIEIDQAIADTMQLTGQLFNRSELVRLALQQYYERLEVLKDDVGV